LCDESLLILHKLVEIAVERHVLSRSFFKFIYAKFSDSSLNMMAPLSNKQNILQSQQNILFYRSEYVTIFVIVEFRRRWGGLYGH
jgi:hypothetical protein